MLCSCRPFAHQTGVAYSPHYKGLMFSCENHESCRSDFEGEYPDEAAGTAAAEWYADRYRLKLYAPGALDGHSK